MRADGSDASSLLAVTGGLAALRQMSWHVAGVLVPPSSVALRIDGRRC